MRRSGGNFGGYRGRRTFTDLLRIIAVVLAAAVILVLAALLAMREYIVYTDEGLRLPFFEKEAEGQISPLDPGSITIKEENGTDLSQTDPAAVEREPLRALQIPVSRLLDGTALSFAQQAGANAVVLVMKDESGTLSWKSQVPLAVQSGVNGTQELGQALAELKGAGLRTVARVCCFRDDSLPYYDTELALRTSGGNWRDEKGLRWLSPASSQARDYLSALCGELAGMGFDEILLEEFSFPVEGSLSGIVQGERYDPALFSQQVEEFLTQVKEELAASGASLSLMVKENYLAEDGENGGVTPALLQKASDLLWVGESGILPQLEERLDREARVPELVKIVEEWSEAEEEGQAVLTEHI